MKKLTIAIAALSLVLTFGCNQKSSTTASSQPGVTTEQAQTNLTPEQLGEIGAKIKKHPSDVDKILSDNGLTQATFEKEIRKVSSDPAASRRYRDTYKKNV